MRRTRIRITTPYPTVDDVAKTFGMPPARVRKIIKMVDEIIEQRRKTNGAVSSRKRRLQPRRRSRT